MQAVGHDGDIAKAGKHRHHLQHGASGIKDDGVAIVDKLDGRLCDQRLFMGVDQRFVIDRRVGFIFIQHHAAIRANNGSGIFQNDQVFANGGARGVKVLGQLLNRAFSLLLQMLQNSSLTLTWFHRRNYPD